MPLRLMLKGNIFQRKKPQVRKKDLEYYIICDIAVIFYILNFIIVIQITEYILLNNYNLLSLLPTSAPTSK